MGTDQRTGGRGNKKLIGAWFYSVSLQVRRSLAAAITILIIGGASVLWLLGTINFAHAREAVETQPQRVAVITDIEHKYRGSDDYFIELGDERLELDYANFLDDDRVGSLATYVVDPNDEQHLIVVGERDDWHDTLARDLKLSAALCGLVLFLVGTAVHSIVPEDFEKAMGGLLSARDRRKSERRPHRQRKTPGRHAA